MKERKRHKSAIGLKKSGKVAQYAVETLLDKRVVGAVTQYLARWDGYGEEDDAWISAEDISDDLIDEYEPPRRRRTQQRRRDGLAQLWHRR